MKNKRAIDLSNFSDLEIYLLIRNGSLDRFPIDFLNKDTCKVILRWLCLNHYHLTRKEICHLNQTFLFKNFIGGFRKIFSYNMFSLIQYSFEDLDIKRWETAKVPNGFWKDRQNQKEFIEWLAKKENLDLTSLKDVSKISAEMINRYGASKARRTAGGVYSLITSATGDRFQEWEILKLDVWTEEKAIKAVKWLVEEKLKWSDEQVYENLTASVFQENHLGGLLERYCNNSPIKAINLAYPGKFKSLKHSKS